MKQLLQKILLAKVIKCIILYLFLTKFFVDNEFCRRHPNQRNADVSYTDASKHQKVLVVPFISPIKTSRNQSSFNSNSSYLLQKPQSFMSDTDLRLKYCTKDFCSSFRFYISFKNPKTLPLINTNSISTGITNTC